MVAVDETNAKNKNCTPNKSEIRLPTADWLLM